MIEALLSIAAPLVIVFVYASAKAGTDTMNDHWDQSIFLDWSDGRLTAFWGHRDHVYLRRKGSEIFGVRVFEIPVVADFFMAFWDGFHLLNTIRLVALLVGIVFVPALHPLSLLLLLGWYYAVFTFFYDVVWLWRRGSESASKALESRRSMLTLRRGAKTVSVQPASKSEPYGVDPYTEGTDNQSLTAMRYLRKLFSRLSEPSTWAGLTGLLVLLDLSIEEATAWATTAAGLAALLAVFLPEKGVDGERVAEAFDAYATASAPTSAERSATDAAMVADRDPASDGAKAARSVLVD